MPEFHRANLERVNAFAIDDGYLFKYYFDHDEVFAKLGKYYNNQQYRFEVPAASFEEIVDFLSGYGYGLVVVEHLDPFAVAVRKYTEHPENIFKGSVLHRSVGDFNVFLLKDHKTVERAVEQGATPIEGTDLEIEW